MGWEMELIIFANLDTMITPSLVRRVIWNHKSPGNVLMFLDISHHVWQLNLDSWCNKGLTSEFHGIRSNKLLLLCGICFTTAPTKLE